MFNKSFLSFNIVSKNFENIINEKCKNFINYIKKNNIKNLYCLIPIIKNISDYYNIFFIILLILIIVFSNFFITSIFMFFLFDSIILSFLILHNKNIKFYSRRLAKNIIALFILYFNLTGSIISLTLVCSIYYEFNKFINKIIFKFIETFLCFIQCNIPFISFIYPNVALIDYNKPIESSESDSDSDDNFN